VAQVALNWVLSKGALPIPGAKSPEQARQNAGAMGWRLSADEITELERAAISL
jgi:pyridoxine 4-dehydrogenase